MTDYKDLSRKIRKGFRAIQPTADEMARYWKAVDEDGLTEDVLTWLKKARCLSTDSPGGCVLRNPQGRNSVLGGKSDR